MTLHRLVFAALAMAPAALLGQEAEQARLTIDKNVYNVPIGKAFAVRIGGKRVTLRIDPQTDLEFKAAGVSFRHPTSLKASQSDAGEGVTIWTLQGRNAAVMLQQYAEGLDPKSLLDVMVNNLIEREGEANVERQEVKLNGPERAYPGVQLSIASPAEGGQPATQSVQNVFAFANAEGVFALLLQDVRAPGEPDSGEYQEALRLLGESLKTGDEPAPPETEAADGDAG